MSEKRQSILVLCTGNSARSQMAEGILRSELGEKFEIFSAGTKPSSVRPEAIKAMAEIGIDITGQRSKSVDEFAEVPIDHVLTVCDNAMESCPYFPAATLVTHRSFGDPAEVEGSEDVRRAAFRRIRDQITTYVREEYAALVGG